VVNYYKNYVDAVEAPAIFIENKQETTLNKQQYLSDLNNQVVNKQHIKEMKKNEDRTQFLANVEEEDKKANLKQFQLSQIKKMKNEEFVIKNKHLVDLKKKKSGKYKNYLSKSRFGKFEDSPRYSCEIAKGRKWQQDHRKKDDRGIIGEAVRRKKP